MPDRLISNLLALRQSFSRTLFVLVVVFGSAVHTDSARGDPIVETFESFADQTVLTTQIPGLTISADTGTPTVVVASFPVVLGEPKGLAHIPFLDFPDILLITFNSGVSLVGAIVDFGNVGAGVKLTAFDGSNATGNVLGTDSTVTETAISVSAAGIRSAKFETLGGASYLIDNLTYEFEFETCFAIDAIDDQFSVINDGSTADFAVLTNDECSSDTPISVVELPGDLLPDRGGSAATDGDTVSYTPAAGFVGFEEFTYTAQDAGLDGGDDQPAVDQGTATVVVNVLQDLIPDAVADLATTLENQATIIDVLENDSLGNAPNQLTIETEPANGSVTLQGDDTIRYAPNFDFFGEDRFEYRLTDTNGDSDVATVTVGVFFVSGQVPIDIMPTDDGNNLNLRAGPGAGVSVAILSVGEFFEAPNLIDPLSLKFGPRQGNIFGSPQVRDVDGDGDEDLIVKFLIQQSGIACGDTQASLSGRTFASQSISGSDTINTFNCPRIRKRH